MALDDWFHARPVVVPETLAPVVGTVAVTAGCLGALAGVCLPRAIALVAEVPLWSVLRAPPLHAYLLAWATFHMLEFVVTAFWNVTHLQSDSFLLQNGAAYAAAHALGVVEFLVEAVMFPQIKSSALAHALGAALILAGQVLRSLAMVHASTNFSHAVAYKKRAEHELVTTGVYAYMRHPSYAGFFAWALGTQILLGNPIGTVVFAVVLWRFFAQRIAGEERALERFFPGYAAYRWRVASGVPWIN